jgi:hypothetical protein
MMDDYEPMMTALDDDRVCDDYYMKFPTGTAAVAAAE